MSTCKCFIFIYNNVINVYENNIFCILMKVQIDIDYKQRICFKYIHTKAAWNVLKNDSS